MTFRPTDASSVLPDPAGPRTNSGSGFRSAWVRAAIADLGQCQQALYLGYTPNVHRFLLDLTRALFETGHQRLQTLAQASDIDKWLS